MFSFLNFFLKIVVRTDRFLKPVSSVKIEMSYKKKPSHL